ncbi:PDZ domain-containing protein [Cavenderia fasciculata]|uniref:PDZ domain-containing protein n=1 Tax=Cavenderia fasciculata TaxID=261658 RepID=F4PVN1_CACFS|nr:PDZ domain-containing protein [Cavenderia fasciculata]EGG20045.1 PDZ domain-containing protein [Cavenderia fasciculata]|eukprot:XP_004367028.1 PDZ domain-containing protein [Cavenderia fasciculata]
MIANSNRIQTKPSALLSVSAELYGFPQPSNANKQIINWNAWTWVDSKTCYVSDTSNFLYKSVNSGFTFQKLALPNGEGVPVQDILFDAVNPMMVMTISPPTQPKTYMLISQDGGQSFLLHVINVALTSLKVNPRVTGNLIAMNNNKNLYVSTDFGVTWNQILTSLKIKEAYWDPASTDSDESLVGIFAIGTKADGTSSLIYTSDFGKTTTSIIDGAKDIDSTDNYLYVAATFGAGTSLYVRSNQDPVSNNVMGFLQCQFPFGKVVETNEFAVLDDTTGAIWLGISPKSTATSPPYSSIYVSNSYGNIFTLQAQYVNHNHDMDNRFDSYDFTPFYGLPGVYIINNVTNPYQAGANKSPILRSLISYNNGGNWAQLAAPLPNPNKQNSLNIFGQTTYTKRGYGAFYSHDHAPGLAFASGIVNNGISPSAPLNKISTFLTRDGGQSWNAVFDNPSIYEFVNYGSILVYADTGINTNNISYSIDGGLTFIDYTFDTATGVMYDIQDIQNDPNTTSLVAIILCTANGNGYAFSIDFSTIGLPVCDPTKDYEYFVTNDILGAQINYTRIKQGSTCTLTGVLPEPQYIYSVCTFDDFECDLGFVDISYNDSQLICAIDPNFTPPNDWQADPPSDCPLDTTYAISRGYRMIAGDVCINGISSELMPTIKNCPTSSVFKKNKWLAPFIIILVLVFAGIGIFFFLHKNPEVKEKILKKLGLSKDQKYSSLGIRPNSLADDEFGIEDDDAQILNDNDLNNDEF